MNKPGKSQRYTQAALFESDQPPLATSGGVRWNLDDPAQPAELEASGRKEPARANLALRAYLQLEPQSRSMAALLAQIGAQANQPLPGQKQIERWAAKYAWAERARHHDEVRRQRNRREMDERQRIILQQGLATTLERVAELKELYSQLKKELLREERVWLCEVKYQRVDDGRYEKVENLRFNAALINQVRGVLADLARETGGRVLKTELSLPQQPAAPGLDFGELSKDELNLLEKVMSKAGLDDELIF